DLRPGVCAARSRQNGYFLCHVERFGSALEAGRRRQNGSGRAADSEVNRSGGTPEGQDVTRYDDDSDASLGDCCAHGDSEHSRYLLGTADNFAKVRTREEEVFGPSLLKEVGTELGAGYLRGDRQDGNATALTIMESIDEMEIARPAASCADRKFACNLRFATSREGGDLLVPNHHPVDAIVSADGIGKSVERVTGDSVDTLRQNNGIGSRLRARPISAGTRRLSSLGCPVGGRPQPSACGGNPVVMEAMITSDRDHGILLGIVSE